MSNNIKDKTHQLCLDILNNEYIKYYLKVKNLYENDKELNNLKAEIKKQKKELSKYRFEKLTFHIKQIKELELKEQNHPLTITYNNTKQEVERLLKPLYDLFK